MILAITGGTGFVGSHLIDHALAQGHHVRALARRPLAARAGVTWIDGALDRPAALVRLTDGADAVIHVAGVVNAPDRATFAAGNIDGTAAMLRATTGSRARRFIQVSSLAAREPGLSDYGWSKHAADQAVMATDLGWTIVRPPAIFGPRDREMLAMFRLARRHILPLPPAGGRMSVLYVEDLVALLLTLATGIAATDMILEPDDGTPDGWSPTDFARAIGVAVGSRVVPLPLPRALLTTMARADRTIRGTRAKLTPDRVRYFCHPDWVAHAKPPTALWQPMVPTPEALARTAAWYRGEGFL